MALRGSGHTTVRLSLPVPPGAFAEHWTRPDATHHLTLSQRQQLLCLTASSGVVSNLEVAVRASGLRMEQKQPHGARTLGQEVLHAAAHAGQLPTCQWLRQQGVAWDVHALDVAAIGGHLGLCKALRGHGCRLGPATLSSAAGGGNAQLVEWLLAEGCPWCPDAAGAAASGGHVGIMETLLRLHGASPARHPMDASSLLQGAAWGCSLADLTRVVAWCEVHGAGAGSSASERGSAAVASAVLSPTPDWAAKAGWLLDERGHSPSVKDGVGCMGAALARPDAAQRLAWMWRRALLTPLVEAACLSCAAQGGGAEAVSELLSRGAQPSAYCMQAAAGQGHLPVLQLLHAQDRGALLEDAEKLFKAAARGGHVAVLDWLAATLFPDGLPPPGTPPLVPFTFTAAGSSGSLPALRWLAERGCPCVARCWTALGRVSVEAVEWLAEHGCPFGNDDAAYIAAGESGNYPVLAALRRVGFPWSAATFTRAVSRQLPVPVLRWMVEEGVPLDLEAAESAAARAHAMVWGVDDPDSPPATVRPAVAHAEEVMAFVGELALGRERQQLLRLGL